jgi:hypothetical protein
VRHTPLADGRVSVISQSHPKALSNISHPVCTCKEGVSSKTAVSEDKGRQTSDPNPSWGRLDLNYSRDSAPERM